MQDRFCIKKKGRKPGEVRIFSGIILLITLFFFTQQAVAVELELGGKELTLSGYIKQSIQFGTAGDHYDTRSGFQQALSEAMIEADYFPSRNTRLFVSGQAGFDWAYKILNGDDDWEARQFDQADEEQFFHDDYEDLLKECHFNWTPQLINLRIGKQIIVWGEMDGVRIMDQINPSDRRRGFTDVEFETSIIPIWLAKLEFYPETKPAFLDDLGIELVFNPNADFIPTKNFGTGNNLYGIWAVNYTKYGMWIGDRVWLLEEPDEWDSDGFEYGLRVTGTFGDVYFTLNYFDGVADSPVYLTDYTKTTYEPHSSAPGGMIIHSTCVGYYPDQELVGFTFSTELESLYLTSLGGVAPMIRFEAVYGMDNTYATSSSSLGALRDTIMESFEQHDEIFYGIAIDWKLRIPLLNEHDSIAITPQFSHRHIQDYPSNYALRAPGGEALAENNYGISVMGRTSYINQKLKLQAYYYRTIKGHVKADLWRLKVAYEKSFHWTYSVTFYMVGNDGYTFGNDPFFSSGLDHKDNISFTVSYAF